MAIEEPQSPHDSLQHELRQAEYEAQQLQQLVDGLLYSLSHDLRSPTMTILGFADLLASALPKSTQNDSLHQYLEHIRNSATRQITLIESLINFAQLSRQPMNSQSNINLSELCQQVWQTFPPEQRERIQFDIAATPTAQGDPELLRSLLHALLDNAIKFTDHSKQSRLRFSASGSPGLYWYALSDNGVGFHPENAMRLFRPFRRMHSNKDFPGVGMGLATAAVIARRHGGDIEAEGQVNVGTTIRFRLAGN